MIQRFRWKAPITNLIKYFCILLGIITAPFKKKANEILILMYHRVNNHAKPDMAVKEKDFRRQMDYLKRNNHRVISMDEAYRRIKNREIDGNYIVLTFDDGYADFYHHVFPVLEMYQFPAIVYLVPGYIDSGRSFPWDAGNDAEELLSWPQIKELNKNPLVTFGSHTMNHLDMDKLTSGELESEIRSAKERLENELNQSVAHFCYPKGIYTETGASLVKIWHCTGVLITNGDPVTGETECNPVKLKRIPVAYNDGKIIFIAKINGWLALEKYIQKLMEFRANYFKKGVPSRESQ